MSLNYILNTNPQEVILKNIESMDENDKKDIRDRVQAQMQTWLGSFENMLEEGQKLPVELIGRATDLATRRREI